MSIRSKQVFMTIGAVALIAVAWSLFHSFQATKIRNLDSQGTTIVAFGDSLVRGVGATVDHDLISLLSQRIGQTIINLGVSGDTTGQAALRVGDVLAQNPKIVIVLLGGNDFLRKVPMDETFANLDQIISTIQASGSAVLLLGIRGGLLWDTYDTRFEELARTRQTGYVPNVLSGLLGDSRYMSDAIHPNDAGYVKVADEVEPVLRKMLGTK